MKKGEKALIYLRNAEYTIDAIDHVHKKDCDEKYKEKYAVQIGKVPATHAPAQFLAPSRGANSR